MITFPTNKLQKVLLGGGCEQNGTPTPDTPIDIVCNNGVLKVNKNLYSTEYHDKTLSQSDGVSISSLPNINVSAMVNCTNVKSFMVTSANPQGAYRLFKYRPDRTFIDARTTAVLVGQVLVLPSDCGYFRIQYAYTSVGTEDILIYDSAHNFGIYTDGTQEVVTDNLGNTANAEMLLAIGEYIDKQSVLDGVVTSNVGIKVLNGTEDWVKATGDVTSFWLVLPDRSYNVSKPFTPYCTHCQGCLSNNGSQDTVGGVTNGVGFWYKNISTKYYELYLRLGSITSIKDATTLKAYLADQYNAGTPVIIVYPLATPTTEQVTPQPLAGSSATVTAGSIDNLPIESSTITELKKRYIGDKAVERVYIGDNLVWEK